MNNEGNTNKNRNNSHKSFPVWVQNLLMPILGAVILGLIGMMLNMYSELSQTRQLLQMVQTETGGHTQWIANWHEVLKVPERDQAQDNNIKRLLTDVKEIQVSLRQLEIAYAKLGGPGDPLYGAVERLQQQIDFLK